MPNNKRAKMIIIFSANEKILFLFYLLGTLNEVKVCGEKKQKKKKKNTP